ncbi:MAG: hypothetical protein K2N35_03430, partial [Muribaculaceae bacterium]|nr:hypothetical protein [Muribaculaceae bacterium]
MNKKMKVNYHIDKLVLVYRIPEDFMTHVIRSISTFDFLITTASNVFIFSKKYLSVNYTNPIYILEYKNGNEDNVKIAEFRNDIQQAITVTLDNKLFYSGRLKLLYDFENLYNLTLEKIVQIDVACDCNINLPKKLNDFIHRCDCTVKRIGTKIPVTEKGNQILGTKVIPNIKIINDKEKPKASFYYNLKSSGNRRPIIFRGYNKTLEIKTKSHKTYIEEANGYGTDDVIYRFEVSIIGRDLKRQSKKDESLSFENVYMKLDDECFLKKLFITYINRIGNLWIKNN